MDTLWNFFVTMLHIVLRQNLEKLVIFMESNSVLLQANGIAESKVKILKSLLRSMVKQRSRNWDEYLHFATFAFNTSFNARIGHTPFSVDHGYEANLPGKLPMFLLNQENKLAVPQNLSPYCTDLYNKTQFCHQY